MGSRCNACAPICAVPKELLQVFFVSFVVNLLKSRRNYFTPAFAKSSAPGMLPRRSHVSGGICH